MTSEPVLSKLPASSPLMPLLFHHPSRNNCEINWQFEGFWTSSVTAALCEYCENDFKFYIHWIYCTFGHKTQMTLQTELSLVYAQIHYARTCTAWTNKRFSALMEVKLASFVQLNYLSVDFKWKPSIKIKDRPLNLLPLHHMEYTFHYVQFHLPFTVRLVTM